MNAHYILFDVIDTYSTCAICLMLSTYSTDAIRVDISQHFKSDKND